jgi:hypothetical protein
MEGVKMCKVDLFIEADTLFRLFGRKNILKFATTEKSRVSRKKPFFILTGEMFLRSLSLSLSHSLSVSLFSSLSFSKWTRSVARVFVMGKNKTNDHKVCIPNCHKIK